MLDHMTFRVTDLARTKAFYEPVLKPLGYVVGYEGNHGSNILGFTCKDGEKDVVDTWFVDGPSPWGAAPTTGCHLCWRAPSRAAVDAFYAAALAAGGKDNGPPGLRPHYHANYYGAFVLDPDGNNIEAVFHEPV